MLLANLLKIIPVFILSSLLSVLSLQISSVLAEENKIDRQYFYIQITSCLESISYTDRDVEQGIFNCLNDELLNCSSFEKYEKCMKVFIRPLKRINSDLLNTINDQALINEYEDILMKYRNADSQKNLYWDWAIEVGTLTAASIVLNSAKEKQK